MNLVRKPDLNISLFDSVGEYLDFLEKTPVPEDRGNSSFTGSESFTGTRSYQEAVDLCRYGDEELRAKIQKTISTLVSPNEYYYRTKQEYRNDVVGFTPNVPNYVMGIHTNMIKSTRKPINQKVLNIFISISASAFVSAADILENGAKCVAAINQLEKEGYRCNVWTGDFGEKFGKTIGVVTKIKTDRQPLNLATMAFPMAHPSMLRRLSFKHFEIVPIDFTHDGYGRPYDKVDGIKKYMKEELGIDNVTVFSTSRGGGSVNNIAEQFKKGEI